MKTLTDPIDPELYARIVTELNNCGSDKESDHYYSLAYEYFFNRLSSLENMNFLEIGIANREPEYSSLHGWSKIFPDSMVYGIDIAPRKMIDTDRIKTFVANQGEPYDLSMFKKNVGDIKFDIILDDGAHTFNMARVSFDILFNSLKQDGIYLIEDVSKLSQSWEQTVSEWNEYLSSIPKVDFEIIDCRPDREDDSVVIGIWRK